jgi:ribonucleoside-diphosphate reductase alpha chain
MTALQISKKIKGYSVVRPEDRSNNNNPTTHGSFTSDMDRRLVLSRVPQPLAASLRWEKRPQLAGGNASHCYMVDSPNGKFAVLVGHVPNSKPEHGYPFECWVLGEAPRGLNAVCKSLSMDMRSRDRGWLKAKLDSLTKCPGESFDMTMPDGNLIRVKSDVAAFAHLVRYRCAELGAFDDEKLIDTPVLDALMSKKEPKAGPDGTLAWNVAIKNDFTGDDFELFVKEAVLECGQKRPFSVWFAGDYAPALDGLAKCLSFDLRVSEVAWSVLKLRQLLDVAEPRGEFRARVPGSEKTKEYPSTVAYVAALILHRLKVLGLVDERGEPTHDTGVIDLGVVREARAEAPSVPNGRLCNACGSYAVVRVDGCDCCKACSASSCS